MPGEEAPPSLDGAAGRGQGTGRDVLLASVASLDFSGPLSCGETRSAVPTVAGPMERSCLQPVCSEAPGLGMECPSPPAHPAALLAWLPSCPPQGPRMLPLWWASLPLPCPGSSGDQAQVEAARWVLPCPPRPPLRPRGKVLLSTCLCPGSRHTAAGRGLGGAPSGPALAQSPAAYTHSF